MAEWKKVIVSGSIAELNQVTASGGFSGDGSGLTGISADSLANNLIVDNSTIALDSGTTFNGSAEVTISVKNSGVTLAKIANIADDTILGNASGNAAAPSALTAANVRTLINVENGADVTDATNVAANLPSGTISSSAQVNHDQTNNFASNEHFTQGNITTVGTVTAGSVTAILPSGTISSSAQVNHDQTANFASNEHFTQANITTVGTVTAGSVTAILPSGTISSSAQVTLANQLTDGNGITDFTYDGSSAATVAVQADGSTLTVGASGVKISDGGVGATQLADDSVNGDKLANDITIANDLTVTGNLLVSGDSVTVNTANLAIEDQFILLNSGSLNKDVGIVFGGTTGTVNTGKALLWDHSYNGGGGADGRLAVSTTAVAANNTTNFGAGTAGYYVAGVFEGTATNAATAKADHNGNIRIESNEIYIYA